ncbi:MAG: hypothetical protein ACRDSH_08065 [Pseudonocardiaceae bacterium]
MRKLSLEHNQAEGIPPEEAQFPRMGAPRRVFVKGMQGVDATVVVTAVQGKVWLSVSPPFTREAIMEPGKVDELMHVLELARDEAQKMAVARGGRASREGKMVAQPITITQT